MLKIFFKPLTFPSIGARRCKFSARSLIWSSHDAQQPNFQDSIRLSLLRCNWRGGELPSTADPRSQPYIDLVEPLLAQSIIVADMCFTPRRLTQLNVQYKVIHQLREAELLVSRV